MTAQPTTLSSPPQPSGQRRASKRRRSGGFRGQVAEVDLRLLRVFRTVAERGGFSAAEIALGKSKSSISIDISALENRLNIKLCQRGRSGFALTGEGRMVLEATEELLSDIDRFQQRINSASGILSGRFSFYMPDNILIHGETAVIRAIKIFTSRNPSVFMNMCSASPREVELAVLDGRATAGIVLHAPHRPDLQSTALFTESLGLYCGASHPLAGVPEEEITLETLTQQRMIEVSSAVSSPAWDRIKGQMTFCAGAENVDARALLILSGNYIGFLPEAYARPLVEDGLLRHIGPESLRLMTSFHFLVRPSPDTSLMIETFRTILEESY
ncbi:LysR family transcriptional regulator [Novacetimonas pomaceti]|uniref:LysR family transcriptional regulator n=1 Tax=Novacetimonas pomaceti TaxID=2021998 RepID=A0A318QD71_9PROT|nr:LysR family transcriptional regulator [Novacetimonas pomaceti]PYD75511.1 LysR family transcriptional regulator [Novacetimonas pomaceti]